MKTHSLTIALVGVISASLLAGCSANHMTVTNPSQPGPALGIGVGAVAGSVGGNVAGFGVGVVEGAAAGAKVPFNNTRRIITRWHTETTTDGRTIQVADYILVDQDGRPINPPPAEKK